MESFLCGIGASGAPTDLRRCSEILIGLQANVMPQKWQCNVNVINIS